MQGRAARKRTGAVVVTLGAGAAVVLGGAVVVVGGAALEEPDEHPATSPAAARTKAAVRQIRVKHLRIDLYGSTDQNAGCSVGPVRAGLRSPTSVWTASGWEKRAHRARFVTLTCRAVRVISG